MHRFNIRVYGILVNEQRQVLVSDELIRGNRYTKFPGGGLEYGEGTRDCLKREFMEEMNLKVEVDSHLYKTDYFHPGQQIISIYYLVHPLEEISVRLSNVAFDFDEQQMNIYNTENEIETFRFIDWNNLSEESVTLPIDKLVVKLIKENRMEYRTGNRD